MKTVKEWVHEKDIGLSDMTFSMEAYHTDEYLEEMVAKIQLDAWNQGMTDAARECHVLGMIHSNPSLIDQCNHCCDAILKARDAQAIQNNPAS